MGKESNDAASDNQEASSDCVIHSDSPLTSSFTSYMLDEDTMAQEIMEYRKEDFSDLPQPLCTCIPESAPIPIEEAPTTPQDEVDKIIDPVNNNEDVEQPLGVDGSKDYINIVEISTPDAVATLSKSIEKTVPTTSHPDYQEEEQDDPHTNLNHYLCNICQYQCARKIRLQFHMRIHRRKSL